jgi:hypothetical protein
MKIKYWGAEYEKGLLLTADLFDKEGTPVLQGISMQETAVDSAIYITDNINTALPPGVYVTRIIDNEGNFIGHDEILYNGLREVTLLELKFMSETELMQLRDALGLDGDKMVARGGQLQNKSEAPYNEMVNTTRRS